MTRQPNNASSNSDNWLSLELAKHSDYAEKTYRAEVISWATLTQLWEFLADQDLVDFRHQNSQDEDDLAIPSAWESDIYLANKRFEMLAGCKASDWKKPRNADQ
jgi:hypothetical protein